MPRRSLNDRFLRTVKVSQRTDFVDETFPDFGVRVSEHGAITFWLRYRIHGKRRRARLGRYPRMSLATAREEARRCMKIVWRGEDPKAGQDGTTFAELAADYLAFYAEPNKKARSAYEDRRVIERELLPAWGSRPADSIERRDVAQLLDGIVGRGSPQAAVRIRQQLSKMFNWGRERDLVTRNPCHGLSPPAKLARRERVLTKDELRRVWVALPQVATVQKEYGMKLRALTLQRGVEVYSMRYEELDGQWWTIPAHVSKNGRPHRVWLPEAALELVLMLQQFSRGGWVFPSPQGGDRPMLSHDATLNRKVRKAAGLRDFRPHDLRRTGATLMTGELGIPRFHVAKVLNHTDAGVTRIYDRYAYDREKREALEGWAGLLHQIVG